MVDKLAGEALLQLSDKQKEAPISLLAIKAMIKSGMKNVFLDNLNQDRHRYDIAGRNFTDLKKSCSLPRADEILLSQLRTGESKMMGVLRSRLGIGSIMCRWCNISKETVNHIYSECSESGITDLKKRLNVKDMKVLHENPELGLKFCKEAILLLNEK